MTADETGHGSLQEAADGAEAVDETRDGGGGASVGGAEARRNGAAQHGVAPGVGGAVNGDEEELRQPER